MTGTSTEPTSPATPETAGSSSVASAVAVRRRRTRRRVFVVFALLAVAVIFLLVEGLGSSLDYFDTVAQALSNKAELGTSTLRLEGNVVPGSIQSTATGADFKLSQGDKVVAVANSGNPPQLFRASCPVVVVGHFASTTSDRFLSTTIEIKHSSTYSAQYPGRVRGDNGTVC